jgi:transposase
MRGINRAGTAFRDLRDRRRRAGGLQGKTASEPRQSGPRLRHGAALAWLGLEAGPTSEWIGASLATVGFPVVCLETRYVKAALSAMVVKTDRNDARGIAQIVRAG